MSKVLVAPVMVPRDPASTTAVENTAFGEAVDLVCALHSARRRKLA